MSPDELAAIMAEHDNAPLYCPRCPPHYAVRNCLPYRLASLVSEQAAALARVGKLVDTWEESATRPLSTYALRAALAGEHL